MSPTTEKELLTLIRKVDQLHQDWFGVTGQHGLRHVVLETRDQAMENRGEIAMAKTFIRWVLGLMALIPTGLGLLAWVFGMYTPRA